MKRLLPTAALACLLLAPLSAALFQSAKQDTRQVRVSAERASVYIEPSRGSTRIDIVVKGTVLNLLQRRKVNDIWYHVSYSSARYGTRVSGFVLDAAVEPASEPAAPAPEEKEPPPLPPKPETKEETRPAPPPPSRVEMSLLATSPPEKRTIPLPQRVSPLVDQAWKTAEITPAPQETARPAPSESPRTSELIAPTSLPANRAYVIPAGAVPLADHPWKVEGRLPLEEAKPAAKTEPKPEPPPPPAKKKEEPPSKPPPPQKKSPEPRPVRPPRPPALRKGPGGLSFGLGYGSSFGGAGACLQFSTGMGLALHAGVGVFPTKLVYSDTDWVKNETLWSVGLKYYLPVRSAFLYPYVDIQYGGLRVEAAQVVIGIWDFEYVYSREQKPLWGPSLLAGVELRAGRFGLCGALGVSYVTTSWDYLENRVSLSFDTSLVVHF